MWFRSMLIRVLTFSSFHPLDEEQSRERSDRKRYRKLSSLRRFGDQTFIKAAQTGQFALRAPRRSFPFITSLSVDSGKQLAHIPVHAFANRHRRRVSNVREREPS